jgi:hypothetical protein
MALSVSGVLLEDIFRKLAGNTSGKANQVGQAYSLPPFDVPARQKTDRL